MNNIKFIFWFVLSFPFSSFSQSYTPQEMVTLMGTGINVGNILSAPYEGNWAPPLTETYIDNLYRLGFKTVRIPIRFDNQTTPFSSVTYSDGLGNYIGSPAQYTVNTTYLNRINTILDWCLARNMVAIIDVHGDHWFWGSFNIDNEEYKTGNDRLAAIDRFKAIWRDISTAFQNKSETVLFEIMNEPYFDMSASEVDVINTQILAIIRQNNPTRNVIVTGGGVNSWQAPMEMSSTFLQSDAHLIATFHYYIPFNFTNSSSPTQNNPDYDWGSATDKATVDNHFSQVKTWSVQNNIPVFLGEFGADNVNGMNYSTGTSTIGPNVSSRLAYHQYVSQAARNRGFAMSVWDAGDQSKKTIYIQSNESWVKDVRNVILNSSCTDLFFINNADVNCNYDYNFTVTNTSGAVSKLNNATPTNAYENASLNVIVTTTSGNYTNVMVSNDIFTTGFTSGHTYYITCFAKGDAGQEFKFRVKSLTDGSYVNTTSSVYTLTNTYSPYTYSYTVPANTTSVQLQLLCGKNTGNYFFDSFEITDILGDNTVIDTMSEIIMYPNPAIEYFVIESKITIEEVSIFGIDGRLILKGPLKKEYSIQYFPSGIYWIKIEFENGIKTFKRLIKL